MMDTLVARYGRPSFEDEAYSHSERRELSQATPSLSLDFSLPSLANVRNRPGIGFPGTREKCD